MDETKVQIGEEVLLNIGIHSDWYISSTGYDGESVNITLRKKADRNKEWWLADTPQTDIHDLTDCDFCKDRNCKDCEGGKDEPQTDCGWK